MRSLHRSVPGALVVAACAMMAACERPGQYAEDADTGAAAPATKRDISPGVQPDSTPGVSKPVMRGTISGDTTAREEEAQTVPAPPSGSKKPE